MSPNINNMDDVFFLKNMRFGVELETLQNRITHQSNNSIAKARLSYAQELNNYRESLVSDKTKNVLCKPYFHFQASPLMKSKQRHDDTMSYNRCGPIQGYTWLIDYDGSVRPDNNQVDKGFFGNTEIISPPLSVFPHPVDESNYMYKDFGAFVLQLVMNRLLRVNGTIEYTNNASTSTHVHISCINDNTNYFRDPAYLLAIALAWIKFQDVFFALVSEERRNNMFCRENPDFSNDKGLVSALINAVCAKPFSGENSILVRQIANTFATDSNFSIDRKYGLNLQNLIWTNSNPGIGTIEVRLHHGTMNPQEIFYWVLLISLFINSVMNEVYSISKEGNAAKSQLTQYLKSLYEQDINYPFDTLFQKYIKSDILREYYQAKYVSSCDTPSKSPLLDIHAGIENLVRLSRDILQGDINVFIGGNQGAYKKTSKKVFRLSRYRCVYVYKRKQYVKVKGQFIALNSL